MSHESMSLLEFQERFCDEQACLDHLFHIRWPKGFTCPRCGGRRFCFVRARRLYQCSACRYQASVTAGTVFHKTRTPIRKWFWMIFMMTRQKSGVSILRMQKLLKIGGYRTAWLMGHKIREAMVDRESSYKLAGLIEVNEAIIGQKKTRNSCSAPKNRAKILIGVEVSGERAGFRFVDHVDSKHAGSDESACKERIAAESERSAKGWASAGKSGNSLFNSSHEVATDGENRLSKLRWVYAVMANISGNIRGVHHGVSLKHLQRYLSEYCYRFNLRRQESQLFNRGLAGCLATRPLTWAELTI